MAKGNVTCNDIIKFLAHGTAMPAYGANWRDWTGSLRMT